MTDAVTDSAEIQDIPESAKGTKTKAKAPFLRLLSYMRPYRRDYILGIIYSTLRKLLDIAPEILIGVAVDTVVRKESSMLGALGFTEPKEQLTVLAVLTLVIWVLESITQFLYSIKWRNLAQIVQHKLRTETYDHVQRLDMATLENKRTGTLLSILNDDVNQIERFLEDGVSQIIQIIVSTLVIGAIFFYVTPVIAVIAILPIPVIFFGTFYFQERLAERFLNVREKAGLLGARLSNNLSSVATIKSFSNEDIEKVKIEKDSEEYRLANEQAIILSSLVTPVIRVAVLAGFLVTLVLGGLKTLNGEMEVGVFSVLVFLTQRLLWPLRELAELTVLYQRSMASTKRVLDLLHLPIFIRSGEQSIPADQIRGEIKFEHIDFQYDEHKALSDVSVTVPAGKTIGFVGESGSGKSTLMKLFMRFYEPLKGTITLDGVNLNGMSVLSLRQAVGFVSQDVFLFHGTIEENVAYGRPDASKEDVIEACKKAEAHDFIAKLSESYDTIVGERGQRLSGGQRQRIAFARAILRDAPILVLDEATSAVDNETERAIQKSLRHISKNRTTMIIAHRLSTIRHADMIYVMKDGKVVEEGGHDALLKKSGVYAELWRLQIGEGL